MNKETDDSQLNEKFITAHSDMAFEQVTQAENFNPKEDNYAFRQSTKNLPVVRNINTLKQIQAIVSKETVLWRRNFCNFSVIFILSIILGKPHI